jgi:hypothetical protein
MRLLKPNQKLPLAVPVDSRGSDQFAHGEATYRPFGGNRRLLRILTVRGRVAKRGVVLSRIERDRIRALLQDFASIDYFHLDNIYGFNGSGCRSTAPYTPTVITSLSMGGLSKTLSHHDGCVGEVSEKLKALENSIDKAANTARWVSGKPPASKH